LTFNPSRHICGLPRYQSWPKTEPNSFALTDPTGAITGAYDYDALGDLKPPRVRESCSAIRLIIAHHPKALFGAYRRNPQK
jgi:hypothetical protein